MARKGVTPIAAVLILIAIAVTASLVTYVWVAGYLGTLKTGTEPIQLSEVLKIEGVGYSGGKLRVAVRNVGSRKATIAAVYVLRQDRTAVFARTDLSVDLEPGAAASLEVDAELSLGSYILKLVTKTGVETTTALNWVAHPKQPETQPGEPPEALRRVIVRITVEPPGSGATAPAPGEHEIPAGTTLTITALPSEGYSFSHWLVNGTYYSSEQSISLTVNGDTVLTAVFQPQPRTVTLKITVDPPHGGTTDPKPGIYEVLAGTEYSVAAIPDASFVFLYWLLNGRVYSSEQNIKIIVNEDTELTAVFIEKQQGAPSFRITYWSKHVTGPVGSTQAFTVRLKNIGDAAGDAQVRILDNSATVASQLVTLQPEEEKSVVFTIQLPSTRGVYTWHVIVENTVTGRVDDMNYSIIEAKDLYLSIRNAIHYTAFESPPTGWASNGGSWTRVAGAGRRGTYALQGQDDHRGWGGASFYYRSLPSGGVYIAVQARSDAPQIERLGLALVKATAPVTIYSINLDYLARGGRGFKIERYYAGSWSVVGESAPFAPSTGTWYTIVIEWRTPTLTAYVYDSAGNPPVPSLSTSLSGFTPEHISLIVDQGVGAPRVGYFDNFIISSVDPRYVRVTGLEPGWKVELYTGDTRISSATADASCTAVLPVITDLIVVNAKIVVKDAQGNLIIERSFTEVVGGDKYVYGSADEAETRC